MIDLSAAFQIVTRAHDESGIRCVVVGSTAAATWGVLRATRDIDVVTVVDQGGDALIAHLSRDDVYVPIDEAADAIAHGGTFTVLHPRSGGKVDVFVRRPDDEFALSRVSLGGSRPMCSGLPRGSPRLRTSSSPSCSGGPTSRSEVPWRDCVEIAATQSLDRAYMQSWADRLGVADDLDELLAP